MRSALRSRSALVVTVAVFFGIAVSATAEHLPSSATAQAITRAVQTGPVRVRVVWIRVSSRGPYALAHVTSHASGPADILVHDVRRHWRLVSVISDEAWPAIRRPRAVIRDLHLLRDADGRRCCGRYRG
jgi:hypothetical protein